MKIILLKDIKKVGRKSEVIDSAAGYAQFLIKNGSAELATPTKIAQAKKIADSTQKAREDEGKNIEKAIESLSGSALVIKSKANEQGHLFEGVNSAKISTAIESELKIQIPENYIELSAPLKEVGEHEVGISTDEWEGTLKLSIEAE